VSVADSLQDFVLAYCEEVGGLIERPAYGLVDLLLPDEVARRLGTEPLMQLAFTEETAAAHPEANHLTYGHPLLEGIVEDMQGRGLALRRYINQVRLARPGLFQLIKDEVAFPNAWLHPLKSAVEAPQMYYYVRFNFKVALITDEKQEELGSILMDLHTGQPAWGLEKQEILPLELDYRLRSLRDAPPAWRPELPLRSFERLAWLQEEAGRAMARKLAPSIEALQRPTARRLELDRARLEAFYDDTGADLERRLARTEDEARRRSYEEKLAFARAERERKLADVEAKYRLRIHLELINTVLISQPKITLRARVENRYASVEPMFIWDPLLHRVEPPLCQVCGRPAPRVYLCANGHLADEGCLLHCAFCKRVFCTLCKDDVGICAVCGKPLCVHSQIRCQVCGQVTCQEHVGQCHAPS
jgi:hypothetical protein